MLRHWTPRCPSGLLIALHFRCHCPCFHHHGSLPSLFHTCLLYSVPAGPTCLFSTKNWFEPLVGTCFLSRYTPSLCSSYHTSTGLRMIWLYTVASSPHWLFMLEGSFSFPLLSQFRPRPVPCSQQHSSPRLDPSPSAWSCVLLCVEIACLLTFL